MLLSFVDLLLVVLEQIIDPVEDALRVVPDGIGDSLVLVFGVSGGHKSCRVHQFVLVRASSAVDSMSRVFLQSID